MTPKITDLTDEEINVAIAEWLGWTRCIGGCQPKGEKVPRYWRTPAGREVRACPNFCDDLNAMAIAEASLTGEEYVRFHNCLVGFSGGRLSTITSLRGTTSATAKQRASALLIAVGRARA